jgi:hypothetical protein
VVAVSSLPPAKGVEELVSALDAHLAGIDLATARARMRRLAALSAFIAEYGDSGLRAVGGRRSAEQLLTEDGAQTVPELLAALEARREV